jgi:exodeoxyribonuclease V beta subunit
VAELEIRVRSFIRNALKVSRGNKIQDNNLDTYIKDQSRLIGSEELERRLNAAQLFLDETSVLTIHSFCQQTLKEFAFETGQVFGAEVISPDEFREMVQESFHEFWRKHITTIDVVLLEHLYSCSFNRKDVLDHIRQCFGGQTTYTTNYRSDGFLTPVHQQELLSMIQAQDEIILQKIDAIKQGLINQWEQLYETVKQNGRAKAMRVLFEENDVDAVYLELESQRLKKDGPAQYIQTIFPGELLALQERA